MGVFIVGVFPRLEHAMSQYVENFTVGAKPTAEGTGIFGNHGTC